MTTGSAQGGANVARGDFDAGVWSRHVYRMLAIRFAWNVPMGQLHVESPARRRRRLRREAWWRLRATVGLAWWRARAPLRWAGGCRGEE